MSSLARETDAHAGVQAPLPPVRVVPSSGTLHGTERPPGYALTRPNFGIAACESGWTLSARAYLVANRLAAALLLVCLSPIMLGLAWAIRREGAPVLFGHYRVGARGNLFRCFKFTSMKPDSDRILKQMLENDPVLRAEWARDQKLADDPRITPIGRWLRRSSLDELPQLFNVLRGEMVLVGPRPITVGELKRYGLARWQYLAVLPGMTGLWQVNGRNRTTYERRVQLDELYVRTRSLWLDLKILARTVVVVITRDGAK